MKVTIADMKRAIGRFRLIAERVYFDQVYALLTELGWCGEVGGKENDRVWSEWQEQNCPEPLDDFIHQSANRPPRS